jgi:hypothetical protein
MPNYQNGKIYSIRSRSRPDLVYIGSTTRPLSERMSGHRRNEDGCTSKQIIDIGDSYIELIENFSCANIEELHKREGHFQRSIECVNQLIAGRTPAERYQDNREQILSRVKHYANEHKEKISSYNKQYRQDNKEELDIKKKQYYESNFDSINAKNKEYIKKKEDRRICICGVSYNYGIVSKRRCHYSSIKHQEHIQIIHKKLGLS